MVGLAVVVHVENRGGKVPRPPLTHQDIARQENAQAIAMSPYSYYYTYYT